MGRLTRRLAVLGLLAMLALGLAPVASAASWATFGTPTARSTFGTGVEFSQPVTLAKTISRAELLVTVADAIGPTVLETPTSNGTGPVTLALSFDTSGAALLYPNTKLVAQWRLTGKDDPTDVQLGPILRLTYDDDRFNWQTRAGTLVTVHWYQGTSAFGDQALAVAEDGVRKASELFGVTETEPVDFFVYADGGAFYDAIGMDPNSNVGGVAPPVPGLRTLFALVPPGQLIDPEVLAVIPHELTHLVIETAAGNPYHFLPRWLNEGLAVYESQGYDASDRGLVADAARSGTVIPLDGLVAGFPTGAGIFLPYAESVSAVDFMFRTYGADAVVSVVTSYKDGRTDDEAFQRGLGVDTGAFAAAWLASLGAQAPARYGPQPAPPGPIPSAWLASGGPGAPTATTTAGGPAVASAPATAPAPIAPGGTDSTPVVVFVVVIVISLGLLGLLVIRRGRRRPAGGPEA
jgi:hypothetical protein